MIPQNSDFRSKRSKLPPDAFALHPDGPEPPPRDIVKEDIWQEITSLPDDVSIRTSDDYGTELKAMIELWGSAIDMCTETGDAWFMSSLDIADSLHACIFNSICGFYRVAASCLRATIDVLIAGTYLQLEGTMEDVRHWQKGEMEIKFGAACDSISKNKRVKSLETYLKTKMKYSIFHQKTSTNNPGWARALYGELSNSAHDRPTHSEGSFWEGSNGPIFVPDSFGRIYAHYLDVCGLLYVLAKLSRPNLVLPTPSKWLFDSRNVRPSKVVAFSFEFLWGSLPKWSEST
jgi:hypothetical protein